MVDRQAAVQAGQQRGNQSVRFLTQFALAHTGIEGGLLHLQLYPPVGYRLSPAPHGARYGFAGGLLIHTAAHQGPPTKNVAARQI
ncbi:hypothetical protein GCM10009730_49950 [Streptomyces albidochromogenes]